jgi:predicted RecB family nuclease
LIALDELKGIKPRQIKLLQEAGIASVESLAMSVPDDLALIEGMSEKGAKPLFGLPGKCSAWVHSRSLPK